MPKPPEKNGKKTERPVPAQDPKNGRFLPGNIGGPGRPMNQHSITNLTRERLLSETQVPIDPKKPKGPRRTVTYLQLFVESQITRAINGDSSAAKMLWERIDGKIIQQLEVSSTVPMNAPLIVAVDGRMLDDTEDADRTG